MRSLFMASAVLASTLIASVTAQADFFGEAYLRIFNARVEIFDKQLADENDPNSAIGWRKAVNGLDLDVTGTTTTSTVFADLDGVTQLNVFPNPDVEPAFVGSGTILDNEGFPQGSPNSTPLGQSLANATGSYAYGDTMSRDLAGQLVNELDNGQVVSVDDSDVEVIAKSALTANMETSHGFGDVGTDTSFSFTTSNFGDTFRLVFDYEVELSFDVTPPPDFAAGSASARFSVTGRGAEEITDNSDALGWQIGFADGSFSDSGNFISTELVAKLGSNSFTFAREVNLFMTSTPEPGTLAVFGLSALGVCFVGYRRRRNA